MGDDERDRSVRTDRCQEWSEIVDIVNFFFTLLFVGLLLLKNAKRSLTGRSSVHVTHQQFAIDFRLFISIGIVHAQFEIAGEFFLLSTSLQIACLRRGREPSESESSITLIYLVFRFPHAFDRFFFLFDQFDHLVIKIPFGNGFELFVCRIILVNVITPFDSERFIVPTHLDKRRFSLISALIRAKSNVSTHRFHERSRNEEKRDSSWGRWSFKPAYLVDGVIWLLSRW